MKVYAEFFEENGLKYRTNTILQFGDSWDLIGNAVLANPGSAEPIFKASDEALEQLELFHKQYKEKKQFYTDNWYEFNDDATMQRLEKIFNGWYVDNTVLKLNGVIQLFNTFNIKNQDLKSAVSSISNTSDSLFSKGIENFFHDNPTYFGFSNDILYNDTLRPIANDIFNNSSEKIKSIYKKFEDNSFYHPTYVNRAYKQNHFLKYKEEILLPLHSLMKENLS